MPELPEVEVTRRRIADKLIGRTIQEVVTTKPSYFFLTPPAQLKKALTGRKVLSLTRLGKYLLAALDDQNQVLLHLGMTGQLFTASARSVRLLQSTGVGALSPEAQGEFVADMHTHLVLRFADAGEAVLFRDVRKFGKVRLLRPGQTDPRLDKLGPDALTIDGARLYEAARNRKAQVKTFLLDQGVLAGVGNIYADEALFRAALRPDRAANSLKRSECELLAGCVRSVLARSIETGGSSISDYIQPDGSDGGYQNERLIYARSNEPCSVCKTPIQRIVIGQRSTHYCAQCQK